ncbi:hypothetical protein, partial [Variovorax paradoxus]|uniref:hypothetical protein n=1 Tax=Variovorax paradoxus TaxID=34073 RepID=UPI001E2E0DC5
ARGCSWRIQPEGLQQPAGKQAFSWGSAIVRNWLTVTESVKCKNPLRLSQRKNSQLIRNLPAIRNTRATGFFPAKAST